MRINVKVTPNAKVPAVVKADGDSYNIKVNVPARDGKANVRLIEMLAEHFNVPKSQVRILKGHKSRNKVVEILI